MGKKEKSERESREWAEREITKAQEIVVGEKEKLPAPAPAVTEGPQELEVKSVQGSVNVMGARIKDQQQKATPGMKVPEGSEIKTEPQSQGDFILPQEELKLRLKENSDAVGGSFAYMEDKRRKGYMDLRQGSMCVKIEKEYNGEFVVRTPTLEITAFGTAFCVEVYGDLRDSWVGVVEGEVRVHNLLTDDELEVREGESVELKTLDRRFEVKPLSGMEADMMRQEIRRIGSGLPEDIEPRVNLILPANKSRLETFLQTTAIATNGREPMRVHRLLMNALNLLEEGMISDNKEILMRSVDELETALAYYDDPKYAPQMLMFIGAFYRDIRNYKKAIEVFDKVYNVYPESDYASLAVAAAGRVYEDDLKDWENAEKSYLIVLDRYSESYEVEPAQDGLDRLRAKSYE